MIRQRFTEEQVDGASCLSVPRDYIKDILRDAGSNIEPLFSPLGFAKARDLPMRGKMTKVRLP